MKMMCHQNVERKSANLKKHLKLIHKAVTVVYVGLDTNLKNQVLTHITTCVHSVFEVSRVWDMGVRE